LIVYVDDVAPLIAVPSFRHWKLRGAAPLAFTQKNAVPPTITDVDPGWVAIVGALAEVVTVSVADALVTDPALLLTTTE
jgi:hypothetical protein